MNLAWILRRLPPALLVLIVSAAHAAEDTDQGRYFALPVGHHGDQRIGAQGHGPHADRGPEQEGRIARQETGAGRRRSGLGLGCLYGQGTRTARKGKGRGRIRMLDLQLPKSGHSRLRAIERVAFLSCSTRRRRKLFTQRVLHRRCAKPAGDSSRSLPDEQGRRRNSPLGPARNRQRLPTHDQSNYKRVSRRRRRAPDDITTIYTPLGHSDWREIVQTIKRLALREKRPL